MPNPWTNCFQGQNYEKVFIIPNILRKKYMCTQTKLFVCVHNIEILLRCAQSEQLRITIMHNA